MLACFAPYTGLTAQTLPSGGSFAAGSGAISAAGAALAINQSSARAIINWNSFSIGAGGTVNISNGRGATLNRVTGGIPSQILGTLNATGSVYLVNPQGVVIGKSGVVKTGGTFTASTLDVSNDAFMAGGAQNFLGSSQAQVKNLGTITSQYGDVFLVGRSVDNQGNITAAKGTVGLAAGQQVLLATGSNSQRVFVQADGGDVSNSGNINAAQAELAAKGGNVYAVAGSNGGVISATGVAHRDGRVLLTADDGGGVQITGSISAANADGSGGSVKISAGDVLHQGSIRAEGAGGKSGGTVTIKYEQSYTDTAQATISANGGTGGQIKVEGAAGQGSRLFSSGRITAQGSAGTGGSIYLLGDAITLRGAQGDASGTAGGGNIRVGGDWHGGSDLPQAISVDIDAYSALAANATVEGNGGQVVVWSQSSTAFAGTIAATGIGSGDGGSAEVSSGGTLAYGGLADLRAPNGATGSLLLDPHTITIGQATGTVTVASLTDPAQNAGVDSFGSGVAVLSNGNFVVTAPYAKFGNVTNTGAVYLYSGSTGQLLATLTGSQTNDEVGYSGVIALTNGNYVVDSPFWANGSISNVGAVTWGSGTTGIAGPVSIANSLVGSHANDEVGYSSGVNHAVYALTNGNYVVASPNWDNGSISNAGAVTWANGATGIAGMISATNSLVGSHANDGVGGPDTLDQLNGPFTGAAYQGITVLANGNYVIDSPNWTNGSVTGAGAVTWASGATGIVGTITATNSLIGSHAGDQVGIYGVVALGNGDYVVDSPNWANGSATNAGAVTWGGTSGVDGLVSAANSLVGSQTYDEVGSYGVTVVGDGNYVIASPEWSNGSLSNAGAATWANGTTGIAGTISSANSLVGNHAHDQVGGNGIIALSNGNYVVDSASWANAGVTSAGAVTWGNGATGVAGTISAANSLVGSHAGDQVGMGGVTALTNGNYVVSSFDWANGTATFAGAATWGNGTTGITGTVSAANSLVGTTANSRVGLGGVTALTNGNYVVDSYGWANGSATSAGAVTWGNGTTGIIGAVSATNSLVGSHSGDQVGYSGNFNGVYALTNGNYVVASENWANGSATRAGAATWGNGTTGVVGTISASNSLVGTAANSYVGVIVFPLVNGNYVVASPEWANGSLTAAGAVTWGNGTTGIVGTISAANSLVGSHANDLVGNLGLVTLSDGNYIVNSYYWNNGSLPIAGAVTWGNGATGITGAVSAANSLVGNQAYNYIGAGATAYVTSLGDLIVTPNDFGNAYPAPSAVYEFSAPGATSGFGFGNTPSSDITVTPATLASQLASANVTLQANTDIIVSQALNLGSSNTLTLEAGRSVLVNAGIVATGANLAVIADDTAADGVVSANRDAGAGSITFGAGGSINAGGGNVSLSILDGAGIANGQIGSMSLGTIAAGTLTIGSAGAVNQNGGTALTVSSLALSGAGSEILTNTGNSISTLAATGLGGTLSLTDGGALTIGTVGGVTGVASNAAITINAAGNLAIATGASVTTTASGTALVLATRGIFTNNGGSAALSAANGSWQLWSQTMGNDTLGGLSPGYKQYGATYGTTTPLGSGNGLLYSQSAVITATLTGTTSKTYDTTTSATLNAGNISLSGAIGGDTVGVDGWTSANYATANVGTNLIVGVSGLTITAMDGSIPVYGYTLASATPSGAIGAITPATLTVTGLTASGRIYDANTDVTLNGAPSLSGVLGSDAVGLAGTATGTLAAKNVGNEAVILGGLGLTGSAAGNYLLVLPTNLTAAITPATLTVTGLTTSGRIYDANTDVTLNGAPTLSGVLGSDAVGLAGTATGTLAAKNVGNEAVTLGGLGLTGGDAGNYNLVLPTNLTAAITPATLTVTGLTASGRTYDADTDVTLAGTPTLSGVLGGDAVGLAGTATGTLAAKNVGNEAVTLGGLGLTGGDASNYNLVLPTNLTAAVTPATVTVAGFSAPDRTYDADTDVTLDGTPTLSGVLGNDAVGLTGTATGALAAKNVGVEAITITGLSLTGSGAGNYSLAIASPTVTITPATVTVAGLTALGRTYDADIDVTLGGTPTLSGVLGGDAVGLAGTATGTLAAKNVGNEAVILGGLGLAGGDAGNYSLVLPTNLTAAVTPATLSVTGLSSSDKTYDGTTTDTLVGSPALSGVLGADRVSLVGTASGRFVDQNAGTGLLVTVNGLSLTGTDSGNYTLILPANLLASIVPATVTVTLTGSVEKTYDATTAATLSPDNYSIAGLLNGDAVTVTTPLSGAYATSNVGTGIAVTVGGLALGGNAAANYRLASGTETGSIGTIDRAVLLVAVNDASRLSRAPDPSFSARYIGLLGSDTQDVVSGLRYAASDTSSSPPGIYTISASGGSAVNYRLVYQPGNLTVSAAPAVVSIPPATVTLMQPAAAAFSNDPVGTSSSGVLFAPIIVADRSASFGDTVTTVPGTYTATTTMIDPKTGLRVIYVQPAAPAAPAGVASLSPSAGSPGSGTSLVDVSSFTVGSENGRPQ